MYDVKEKDIIELQKKMICALTKRNNEYKKLILSKSKEIIKYENILGKEKNEEQESEEEI